MCDHEILIEKCEDHRKKHQKFLRMFDNVIQTVLCKSAGLAVFKRRSLNMFYVYLQ